jgi:hypothetical protein
VSASSSSSPAPAPAPAPEPVVDTHDNPATQDDKVASDTTVAPPSAEHRTEPPSAGVPATDRSAPATAKQDPVTSVVDAVVPPGQLKKGA